MGEVQAEFEIPKCFQDAMLHDALAKGISSQQWVENAVRVKILNLPARHAAAAIGRAR